jgi:signal transduction histidine kinase/CheY-like chemotaxis protein
MHARLAIGPFRRVLPRGWRKRGTLDSGPHDASDSRPHEVAWQSLPRTAQLYVAIVLVLGAAVAGAFLPMSYPRPLLFAIVLVLACLTSAWKVNLPIPLASGATLSPSEAASFMTLLLLGPEHAMVVAVTGVWTQCTINVRQPYPPYRTLFSAAAEALTMAATGLVYVSLGGPVGAVDFSVSIVALAAAIATCFVVNTGLVAGAIALSTGRGVWKVWRDDFLWGGVSFMITGCAGAAAAIVIEGGDYWQAALMLAPAYVTYRTYRFFVTRLETEKTLMSGAVAVLSGRLAEAQRQHREATERLSEAREVERAHAAEMARLAAELCDLAHLEEMHNELLQREQAARASAEQANVLKDQFLATVSHELRTPLTSILGWADLLRRGILDDASQDRAGRAIYIGAQRQAQLIDELLDVARIMSQKLQLEFVIVDMKDVVRAAVDIVQPNADAKHIAVAVEEDPSVGVVYGDSGRLQQVATNLLANAVKFTHNGGEVHVHLRQTDDDVEMIVSDNGQGIPRDFLSCVFEPFWQADATNTRAHGGLGLGLSIVKHLVEAHDGSISAESGGEGQGARFTVRLPLAEAGVNQPAAIASEGSSADDLDEQTDLLEGISVLVVDDDDESRVIVGAHLEAHGARVLTAPSAAAALDVLQRDRVDVLLADVAMPGEDGYTFMRKVRGLATTRLAAIPAVALTALARDADREDALAAGFQRHLAKPVEARSLVAAVLTLVRGPSSDCV